jgi:hypothetical protein
LMRRQTRCHVETLAFISQSRLTLQAQRGRRLYGEARWQGGDLAGSLLALHSVRPTRMRAMIREHSDCVVVDVVRLAATRPVSRPVHLGMGDERTQSVTGAGDRSRGAVSPPNRDRRVAPRVPPLVTAAMRSASGGSTCGVLVCGLTAKRTCEGGRRSSGSPETVQHQIYSTLGPSRLLCMRLRPAR